MKNKRLITQLLQPGRCLAFLLVLLLLPLFSFSQKEKKPIYEGNKSYDAKHYDVAEKSYREALNKNKDSYKASFNLGDAYYKQEKYEEAAVQFQALTHKATSKDTLAKAYHNLGNSLLKSKKYQESVDAYKNALKNNPNDADTRYNLACAQQYLKKQQQQQQQKKEQDKKDEKKDDKKDKKDQDRKDKEKKEKEKQDQENKDKQNKEKKDKQEQPKQQISKEDAQRLLDALQNDEKDLQGKMKKGQIKGVKGQIEKDW